MFSKNNSSKNNLTAVTVGFLLIIFIVLIFFFKTRFLKKRTASIVLDKNQENQTKNSTKNDSRYTSIKITDLAKKMNENSHFAIIDIRNEADFKTEHIRDSQNFSSLEELNLKLSSLDKRLLYIIVDNLGLTPKEIKTMDFLSQNDFTNVAYLEGGFTEWKNKFEPTISFGDPYSFVDQSKVNYISSDELKKLLSQKNNSLFIIDLRSNLDFKQGHIPGAVNIPLDSLEKQYRKIFSVNKKIILYDNHGLQAFQGAVRLFDMGILNVLTLSDGFNAWKQKGFEIEK